MGIGIISAGKVGAALGSALRSQGHAIIGAYASSTASQERLESMLPGVPSLPIETIVERAEMVLLAVPDDALAPLVAGLAKLGAWQSGQIVVHTAGRYGVQVLDPIRSSGALPIALHPAMTFTGTSLDIARLQGCPFAVTTSAMLQPIGMALAAEMGGEPVVIAEADRASYHAALAHGANHVVTLLDQSRRMLQELGISEPGNFLRPLIQAAVEGALNSGDALLTGPVVRADLGTLQEHQQAIKELSENCVELSALPATYHALLAATAVRAQQRGVLSAQQTAELLALVAEWESDK